MRMLPRHRLNRIGHAARKDQCFLCLGLLGEFLPDRALFRLPLQALFRTLASPGVFLGFAPCTEDRVAAFSHSPVEIRNFCLQGCSCVTGSGGGRNGPGLKSGCLP